MTNYTPAQLEAWAGLGPWKQGVTLTTAQTRKWSMEQMEASDAAERLLVFSGFTPADEGRSRKLVAACQHEDMSRLLVAAPDLARLVLEKEKEIARLKGLAWIAFHEFNAINARSGGPLDQYGMVTVTHEYWQAITDLFAKAAGETTPWPTENAKAIFEEVNRQAMKETSDE